MRARPEISLRPAALDVEAVRVSDAPVADTGTGAYPFLLFFDLPADIRLPEAGAARPRGIPGQVYH